MRGGAIWQCGACDCLNNDGNRFCAQCGTERGVSAPALSAIETDAGDVVVGGDNGATDMTAEGTLAGPDHRPLKGRSGVHEGFPDPRSARRRGESLRSPGTPFFSRGI